ncbi:MAG: hypothetical protein K2W85_05535 [Phycisphaerales bacterium]|nr:hypothetical protein [Phycisphaerales bacterium]
MSQSSPVSTTTPNAPVWPPRVAPARMKCRRCGYDVSTLSVKQPEGTVQCPECAILTLVPQVRGVESDGPVQDPSRGFQPGLPLTIVAMLFAALGVLVPMVAVASMALSAAALEVSRGRRGLISLLVAATIVVFRVVLPALGFFR